MHERSFLIEEGIIDDSRIYSRKIIINFYESQLNKFNKIGLGKETENEVSVTPALIKITKKRLTQLKPFINLKVKR